MNIIYFHYYLIIINLIGCILFIIDQLLYRYTPKCEIDKLVTISCILGGSIGILIPKLIIQREISKKTEPILRSTVFLYSIIPIQIIIYLMIRKGIILDIISTIMFYFENHQLLMYYLILINIVTFIAFGLDKLYAIKNKTRIRIVTLLGLSFIGGAAGGYLGMNLFNHKTSKEYFYIGLPTMIVMHIIVLAYFIIFE